MATKTVTIPTGVQWDKATKDARTIAVQVFKEAKGPNGADALREKLDKAMGSLYDRMYGMARHAASFAGNNLPYAADLFLALCKEGEAAMAALPENIDKTTGKPFPIEDVCQSWVVNKSKIKGSILGTDTRPGVNPTDHEAPASFRRRVDELKESSGRGARAGGGTASGRTGGEITPELSAALGALEATLARIPQDVQNSTILPLLTEFSLEMAKHIPNKISSAINTAAIKAANKDQAAA
jgi:hypothetical protein